MNYVPIPKGAEPPMLIFETDTEFKQELSKYEHEIHIRTLYAIQYACDTNFEDEFGEAQDFEEPEVVDVSFELMRYKEKLQHFVEEHKNHLVIEKIRNAKPLTEKDIQTLEELLMEVDPNVSKEEFAAVVGGSLNLISFIRSIAGLSEEVLQEKFGEFLEDNKLSSNQIQFVRQMMKAYSQEGKLEVGALFEAPFTSKNQDGLVGVFKDNANIAELLIERMKELNELKVG